MSPQTFIFIGRSGSGKGTQGKLLEQFLREKDPERKIFYMETGQRFREFIKEPGYTQDISRTVMAAGLRQPAFLAIWTWACIFVEKITGQEHLLIDGTPRSYPEALALDSALKFYGKKAHIIYLDIHDDRAIERLLERGRVQGRPDDANADQIRKRLAWFDSDVIHILDYYRNNPDYHFLDINGDQSVADVQKDILASIVVS